MEWYEDQRRRRRAIGEFEQATEAARRKSIEIQACRAGIILRESKQDKGAARLTMAHAIDQYLEYVKERRSPRTYVAYRYTLSILLRASYAKTFGRPGK